MKNIRLFQIFRVGTHTAMNGLTKEYTERDIQNMAAAYSADASLAPLVLGHPQDQSAAPKFGEVLGLSVKNGVLHALASVSDALLGLVRAGSFRNVSASFALPASVENPVPGAYYLRHVGFLGAQPPGVRGLAPLAFSEVSRSISFAAALPGGFSGSEPFQAPAGYTIGDAHRLDLHRAALQIQRDCPAVSYCEAVKMVDGIVTL
jgi:hypothetical protein